MYDLLDMTCLPVDIVQRIDGYFPIEGDTYIRIENIDWQPGGSGNVFILYERLGGRCLPYGPIGDDIYGEWLKRTYEQLGIETKGLILTENFETQVSNCLIDKGGSHTFAATLPTADYVDRKLLDSFIAECRGFYLSGYSMHGDSSQPMIQDCMYACRQFREKGKQLFFDPGPVVGDIDKKLMKEILELSDIVSFNNEEAEIYTGYKDEEAAARAIAALTEGITIVKAGAKGCFVIDRDKKEKWYPGFRVKKIDTMGAGDSFFAAVMYGYQHGWDIDSYMTAANAAGAVKAKTPGTGVHVPTVASIRELLQENGLVWIEEDGIVRIIKS